MIDSPCPLCQGQAQFSQIAFNRKHFKCPSCTEYVLWSLAEQSLHKRTPSHLQDLSNAARATTRPGFIYVISGPTEDNPHLDIQASAQPRSTALAS